MERESFEPQFVGNRANICFLIHKSSAGLRRGSALARSIRSDPPYAAATAS